MEGDRFLSKSGEKLTGAEFVSEEYYRSGSHSLRLAKTGIYGFNYRLYDIKKGDLIEASVWKLMNKGEGNLVIADVSNESKQFTQQSVVTYCDDGWGLLKCNFIANQDYEEVIVYVQTASDSPTYFDDFMVSGFFNNVKPNDTYDALVLNIPEQAMDSLEVRRNRALNIGYISDDLKKKLSGTLSLEGENIPVELRLKGDWTDHVETEKWSLRIKIEGGSSFKGMKEFSIQHPKSRAYMNEWFAHKLLEDEGLLTTKYFFIPVIINGKRMGVYAVEEHFEKQLLERQKRRDGPIVKFSELDLWAALSGTQRNGFDRSSFLNSADIIPFSEKRVNRDINFGRQFQVAHAQMERYRNHDPDVGQYLDVAEMGKFIALVDLLNAPHSLVWHNQRMYFNPVTNQLNPIAYDCFAESDGVRHTENLSGQFAREKVHFTLSEFFLASDEGELSYYNALLRYSSKEYLEAAFERHRSEIDSIQRMLNFEYPNYRFDYHFFQRNSLGMRKCLKEYKELRKIRAIEQVNFCSVPPCGKNELIEGLALKAIISNCANGRSFVFLKNYHSSNIRLLGYGDDNEQGAMVRLKGGSMKASMGLPTQMHLELPGTPRFMFYTADNCGDRVFVCEMRSYDNWEPGNVLPVMTRFSQQKEPETIVFSGKIRIVETLYVPAGKRVLFEAGTKIDFVNGAGFVSMSPVEIQGTATDSVWIYSSDQSASGFTVISNKSSKLSYLRFSDFRSVNQKYWQLTGAMTFYGGRVILNNDIFERADAEDGINFVRCSFEMENCLLRNCFSDGLDADFCQGKIKDSRFEQFGNDALDFSGSLIRLRQCFISGAGDKGISCGEATNAEIEECVVRNSNNGIVAKDLSYVIIKRTSIVEVHYALAAYTKKTEYGRAIIRSWEIETRGIKKKLCKVSDQSVILVDGKRVYPDKS